jgi:hypothetical protein
MRKLFAWILVTLGIAALIRKLRRRSEAEAPFAPASPPATEPTEDPADELRRKLAETRTEDESPPAEPDVTETPPADASVEERRASVYEQGRSALDEMQEPKET